MAMGVPCDERPCWRYINWLSPFWQFLSALERLSTLHPISMIARKRLDISLFPDILRILMITLKALLLPRREDERARSLACKMVVDVWGPVHPRVSDRADCRQSSAPPLDADAFDEVCRAPVAPFLSVRTAFDLYLKALGLPRGSLVVCSALTIPTMLTIFGEHGLVPVPVDIDPDTLEPEPGAINAEVERCNARRSDNGDGNGGNDCGRVRAIYIAHVFGAQMDTVPIAAVAARHDILLWEDCAQIFTGTQGYLGHPLSDASFFSFGVIKRATAFGGGVARIRDTRILAAMLREEALYPEQSAAAYLRRVMQCSVLLAFTSPLPFGLIIHTLSLLGMDLDKVKGMAMKASRGFPKQGLLAAIRHRPCVPLLKTLAWRIKRYSPEGVEIRVRHCNRMLRLLEASLAQPLSQNQPGCNASAWMPIDTILPGTRAHRHTLWLFPVIVKGGSERADEVARALTKEGFDATRAPTSLVPIDRHTIADVKECPRRPSSSIVSMIPKCSAMMDSLVYLPLANNIADSELDRMTLTLARALLSTSPMAGRGGLEGGVSQQGRQRRKRGSADAAQSLVSFALRMDVIAVTTACSMVLAPVMLVSRLLL